MGFYKKTVPDVSNFKYNPKTGLLERFHLQRKCWVQVRTAPTCRGYFRVKIDGKLYMQHLIAFILMVGRMPKCEIDHINGDGLDNRWSNLRETDRRGNNGNKVMHREGKLCGINYRADRSRWKVTTTLNKKTYNLGHWKTKKKAVQIYDRAVRLIDAGDISGLRELKRSINSASIIGRPKINA